MKKYLLFASALLAFASCANDNYLGTEDEQRLAQGEKPITFGSGLNAFTRADKTGAAAATDLNGQFFVWGIKNEATDGEADATEGNLVYKNYVVKWANGSAYTTTSNTESWEYVGYTLTAKEQANVLPNSAANAQTIKYWDYGATDYTFYAFSADPDDISGDNITAMTKTVSVTTPKTVYDKGYTLSLTAAANLDELFFSERVNILKSTNTIRNEDNKYGGNVTFRFHNTATKVRVAMYETIPGYTVTIKKFKVDNDADRADVAKPAFGDMTDAVTTNFAANLQNSPKGVAGTMEVVYESETGATQNWPKVKFTPTSGTNIVLNLGTGLKENVVIGESKTGATYDTPDGSDDADSEPDYTSVFPQENNSQNLKLKLDYVLTAPVTGETIYVTNATAEIPAAYLKWKPGFAYTYIFKISDNTNGSSGTPGADPAGLYPITFDAIEVVAEDGQAEYITTVSEPSITTFGVNSTTKKYVYDGDEYVPGMDIYATIMENGSVVTPVEGDGDGKVNYYSVDYKSAATDAEKAAFPITEASVAEALGGGAAAPIIKCTKNNDLGEPVTSVPTEDGLTVNQKAVKFTALPVGFYAIEYTASTPWTGTGTNSYKKVYKVIKVTAAP